MNNVTLKFYNKQGLVFDYKIENKGVGYNYFILKDLIIEKNPFKERYQNNNDVFMHVRLGDVPYYNPGLNYYLKALSTLNFNKLYISSVSSISINQANLLFL